ncbi:alpha-amylase [Bacillus luteolus]|uniref:alpha-amylase n=1 Tax=Litchfieldia luteola TaxID=682179 RepID=A0ABR9QLE7_9BACI|nr:alpha-amylase family glycosyl hydrolase [Cytobacillus luteolus]MBE4909313.1 alpha-amylase [Cytobacillus luteolus]MBP1940707.1 alpha-amylase [Cytobacillus luteolus]
MGKRVMSLFLIPFLLFCALPVQAVEKEERSWQEEMMYFIMVDRFSNGDPSNDYEVDHNDPKAYHGGDLKGITQKLDYIKDMGFTSIWLTPIFKNEPKGYHGYWIEDFYEVEEHFGTLDDFKELVNEAHKRDMKVILDFVVNHTGYQHPWLNDPTKKDWFHEKKGISNWNNQEQVENRELFGLPDLAQENPETKEYLLEVAKWWIEETNIDGYRLDTVRHVPKWFWEEFSTEVKSVKEDFFLLGEVWHDDPKYVADYTETGIDSFVDYPFFNEAARAFSSPNQSLDRLDTIWQRNVNLYENPYILGNFIDNHDNVRFTRRALEQNENPVTRLKLALSYLYTAPGIPIVYYGTEIAMDGGEDPDNRRLMDFRTKDELVNYIAKLSKVRSGNPALTHGDFELLHDNNGMAVFKRTFEDNTVIIAINNSTVSQEAIIPEGVIESNMSLTGLLSDDTFTEGANGYEIVLDREKADVFILSEKQGIYLPFIILLIAVPLATVAFFWINKRVHRNKK